MIHKLVTLKNVGKFKNLRLGGDNWNGILDDVTIIYAHNGSGKTTLSLLFQSMAGKDELIQRKKTFGSEEPVEIKFIDSDKKEIRYQNQKWNRYQSNIKVFNSHFVENNVYIINLDSIHSNYKKIELAIGEEHIAKVKRLTDIEEGIKKYRSLRKRKRRIQRKMKEFLQGDKKINKEIKENLEEAKKLVKERDRLEYQIYGLSNEFKVKYLDRVNQFLEIFNPSLKITQLQQSRKKILFGLKVSDFEIRTEGETIYSLKYSLSEGDKNALAFSFFMADVELTPNLAEMIIVIDDPVTSFDYGRKNSTISLLNILQRKVGKMLVLTHDLHFCKDLTRRINKKCLNLKIVDSGISSLIIPHDIETESMTGIFKDLKILHDFLLNGANNDTELREIVRCIRPALEGFLRIKYYGLIQKTEWLGDFIEKIKNADSESPFRNNKRNLDELIEINDYSKEYHHSNPYYLETIINPNELKVYVNRTLKLIRDM